MTIVKRNGAFIFWSPLQVTVTVGSLVRELLFSR